MTRQKLLLLVFNLVLSGIALAQPTLSYRNGELLLYPANATEAFSVYRGRWSAADWDTATAILGRRSERGDTLTFRPLVAFTPGTDYTVRYATAPPLPLRIPLPADYASPRVIAHYPTAAIVPSNLLKLHLHFSRPMGAGPVYDHIHLLGPAGDTVARAILPLEPPLWNTERTVLTLWLEPGRIKRELGPNQRLGPILVNGKNYTLRLSPGLRDANGQPLPTEHAFHFSVGERDTLRPDPNHWQLAPPPAGTREPLVIDFREAMDWATATTYLQIVGDDNSPLAGQWELAPGDRRLRFRPDRPWPAGPYTLRIDPRLEDLAGNNLRRLFDRRVDSASSAAPPRTNLPFRVE